MTMVGLEYGIIFWLPISLILLLVFGRYGKINKFPMPYYVCLFLGIVYINLAIAVAFFPMHFMDVPEFRVENNIRWLIDFTRQDKRHFLLNIALTFPLGMGVQFVTNMKNIPRFILVIVLSASIEIIQIIILFTFEPIDVFFDMTDVFCNILGGIIGYGMIYIFNGVCKEPKKRNIQSIWGYIVQVCSNCVNGKKSLQF